MGSNTIYCAFPCCLYECYIYHTLLERARLHPETDKILSAMGSRLFPCSS